MTSSASDAPVESGTVYELLLALQSTCPDTLYTVIWLLPQSTKKALHSSCRFGRAQVRPAVRSLAMKQLWDKQLSHIAGLFPATDTLVLSLDHTPPDTCHALTRLPHLHTITFKNGCALTPDILAFLSRLPRLSSLVADDTCAAPSDAPTLLPHLTNLVILKPRPQPHHPPAHPLATAAFLSCLHLPSLTCLHVSPTLPLPAYCTLLHRSPLLTSSVVTLHVSDDHIPPLLRTHAPQLVTALSQPYLELEASSLSDPSLSLLALSLGPTLHHLRLRSRHGHAPQLSDASLLALSTQCPHLQTLILVTRARFTPPGLHAVCRRLPTLQQLSLTQVCFLADHDLALLATGCPALQVLELGQCVEVRTDGYVELGQLRGMRQLGLVGCSQMTLEAVQQLVQGLPRLAQVTLSGMPSWQQYIDWGGLLQRWGAGHLSFLIL